MAKGIDKQLDMAWRKIVIKRAGNRCEYCGKKEYLNAHHIIGRRNKAVRWEISNGCLLCPACHIFSSLFSAHQTPTLFAGWIINKRGKDWHDELKRKALTPKKWTNSDKHELLNEFKKCLEGATAYENQPK